MAKDRKNTYIYKTICSILLLYICFQNVKLVAVPVTHVFGLQLTLQKGWDFKMIIANKNQPKLLLVDASVLPDVFERVVEAKRLLAIGKVKNLSEAAKEAGISRSALYKYKDYVFMHNENIDERVITLNTNLVDRPGVLSGIINELSLIGANILTVNQNIPVDGVAPVSISARLSLDIDVDQAMDRLEQLDGVVEVRVLTTR